MHLEMAVGTYKALKERIAASDPTLDEETLADTLEGLTDLPDIVAALVRSALHDEALASGLKLRLQEMESRLERIRDRASKRRQIAKDIMVEIDLAKLTAPDFTVSLRAGGAKLIVENESRVPSEYWTPQPPKLNRQELLSDLQHGIPVAGAALSQPEPILTVRTK